MDIEKLTLEQKVGQLFLLSFEGTGLLDETGALFKKYCIGNYIYFTRNLTDYKNIRALSDSLQALAQDICGIPAFISADQEGGMVLRAYSGTTHFPSNMALTASGASEATVEQMGKMVGDSLKRLGININHAPVADTNNNPKNPVIGPRSYSSDAKVVAKMVSAYIKGLQSSGVMANVKHFPGHGDTDMDSHLALPTIEHDMNRLEAVELVPFRAAFAAGVDSLMSAHILFKTIDSEFPATLSEKIITGLLREEMKFEGLILTDCMSMDAISKNYTIEKACIMAINAGVNIICLNADAAVWARCVEAVWEAAKTGEIPMEKINSSLNRILKYKQKYAKPQGVLEPQKTYEEHEKLADEISQKSITLIKDDKDLLPLSKKVGKGELFVISTARSNASLADDSIVKFEAFGELAAKAFTAEFAIINTKLDGDEAARVALKAAPYSVVLLAVSNAVQNPGQVLLYKALKDSGKKVLVIALGTPYEILLMEDADVYIAAYEYTNRSLNSVIKALKGEIEFRGELPGGSK